MEVIDGSWIAARLGGQHGRKAALAKAIGIPSHMVSKILKGERQVKAHEIPDILAFFDLAQPSGLAESPSSFAAAPFAIAVKPTSGINALTQAACPGIKTPFHYRASRSALAAGVLSGDVLVMAHGTPPTAGALVLISRPGPNGEGVNELRRYFPPHLISVAPDDGEPVLPDDGAEAAIIGHVVAVLRVPQLIAETSR